jgi:hypothetical protein
MGRWVLTTADGTAHTGVMAVRAFPIQSPEHGVSIMDAQGHELAWVDDLVALPEPTQSLLRQALQGREFMPEIVSIRSVSGFITPCTWFITTDRGDTELLLKGDEDIRRVALPALRHRVILNFQGEAESRNVDQIVEEVITSVSNAVTA